MCGSVYIICFSMVCYGFVHVKCMKYCKSYKYSATIQGEQSWQDSRSNVQKWPEGSDSPMTQMLLTVYSIIMIIVRSCFRRRHFSYNYHFINFISVIQNCKKWHPIYYYSEFCLNKSESMDMMAVGWRVVCLGMYE